MMASLTAFDIVVLLIIALGALAGLARGFVTEVLSLLAWVAGIVAVRFLYVPGKAYAAHLTGNEAGGAILAFAVIFLTAYIGFRYIAQMLGSRTRASIVGPVDRLLGFGFGAFKGLIGAAILFLLLTMGLDLVDNGGPRPAWLQAGRTEPLLEMTSKAMIDFVQKTRGAPVPDSLGGGTLVPHGIGTSAPSKLKPDAKPGGYSETDRGALDQLLGKADGGSDKADKKQ
jgi:membrane protein required for colicin V production